MLTSVTVLAKLLIVKNLVRVSSFVVSASSAAKRPKGPRPRVYMLLPHACPCSRPSRPRALIEWRHTPHDARIILIVRPAPSFAERLTPSEKRNKNCALRAAFILQTRARFFILVESGARARSLCAGRLRSAYATGPSLPLFLCGGSRV
jgi:hypothetical protein